MEYWLFSLHNARRLECYQCSTPRPKNPARVNADPEGPSNILKVSGLEPQTSEDALHYIIGAHVPVKDVRLVRDKFTAASRGFAFLHFHSVSDAAKAMQLFQNVPVHGQETPLKLCYAKDRLIPTRGAAANAASDALQAAQAMQQYSSWEPKEFDETAQPEATPGAQGDHQAQQQAGFTYDPNTGYYYDPASGYYYDANTGMYYNSTSQQWCVYDQATGQYFPYSADTNNEQAGQSVAPSQPVQPKRGAIIGSAPKLNPEGLLAAANQVKAGAQQKKDSAKKKAATSQGGKPGIGMVSKYSSTVKRNAATDGATPLQQAVPAAPRPTASSTPVATHPSPPSTVPQPTNQPRAGAVQGVIHRGKWSKQRQAAA